MIIILPPVSEGVGTIVIVVDIVVVHKHIKVLNFSINFCIATS